MFELIPWGRHRDVDVFRGAMDSLFDRFFEGQPYRFFEEDGGWLPSVDVSETDKEFIVKAELPGMEAKDIDVSLQRDVLTIRGERKNEHEEKEENFHRVVRSYGSFCRAFRLPREVDGEKVDADYKDGVLKIRLPKGEVNGEKKIEVKAA